MPRLPRLNRRDVRIGLLAAAEGIGQFLFGLVLGTADITAVYSTPVGPWRDVVWVITILISAVAIVAMNRAINIAHGRRPRRHRNLSRNSQTHNLSKRGLNRRVRRG